MSSYAEFTSRLEECSYRLAFLTDAFSQNPVNQTMELTYDGQMGLCLIMDDIRHQIRTAEDLADELYKGVQP